MSAAIQLQEKYQVLPSMPPEQFEALKADIQERGVLTPIDVDENGFILDGHHRYRACRELGVTDFPTIVRPSLTEEAKRMFARKSNALRRHLTRTQLRQIIAEQLKDTPNWADNRIAQELGTDSKTVRAVRERLEATSEIPKFDKLIGMDGKARPRKRPPAIMANGADELRKVLDRIANGGDVKELEGFGLGAQVIQLKIDYWGGLIPDEISEWERFITFIVDRGYDPESASAHAEWLRRKEYRTPTEWIKDDRFRRAIGMKPLTEKFVAAWFAFRDNAQGAA